MITAEDNQYSSNCISRRAFNPNGRVGSRYDARLDKLISHTQIELPTPESKSENKIRCRLIKNSSGKNFNLMKELDIHHDLRLSILLKLTSDNILSEIIGSSPPIHRFTHVINYTAITRREYLPREKYDELVRTKPPESGIFGTHVIIQMDYGFDAVLMFNFNEEDGSTRINIDGLLEKICNIMQRGEELQFTHEENVLLKKIKETKFWSNRNELTTCQSIIDFHQIIEKMIKQTHVLHLPYNYYLCPIPDLYSITNVPQCQCICISQPCIEKIEEYFIWLLRCTSELRERINQGSLSREEYQADLDEIHQMYTGEVERFKDWIYNARESTEDESVIDRILTDDDTVKLLREQINNLSDKLDAISMKKSLTKTVFKSIILTNNDTYSSDSNSPIISKLQQTENDRFEPLINSDFLKDESISREPKISSFKADEKTIFNILLFGESGAGKSTFINALVNYLRFDTFQQAEKSQPIVLLPISFMVTTGHDFEEYQVEYPGLDDGCDERYGEEGQSVTQHCRSYLFKIKDDQQKERTVRLIDTPGLGDTRGIEQDEKNLQQIIAYINHLTYLHAVCIVMRPNVTRLNISFRLCLTKFFDLFGGNADEFIFFCFTNTRSTFYSPGSTGPILRQFLETLPRKRTIPFAKTNTFCFDSESFRYLVAKQRGVQFDSESADECKSTWERSSVKSQRFIRIVLKQQHTYDVRQDEKFMHNATRPIDLDTKTTLEKMERLFQNQNLNSSIYAEKGRIRNASTTDDSAIQHSRKITDDRDQTDPKQIILRNSDANVATDVQRITVNYQQIRSVSVFARLINELGSDSRVQIITDKIKEHERVKLGRHEFQVPVSDLHLNIPMG